MKTCTESKAIRFYVVEEQELYKEVYEAVPGSADSGKPFHLMGIETGSATRALDTNMHELDPDVLVMGTRDLRDDVVEALEQVRVHNPGIGLVLLFAYCTVDKMRSLQKLATKGGGGMALALKQSLDDIGQLRQIILAASQGQVILDPALTTFLFNEKPRLPFSEKLTARESEILSLVSKGHTNAAIAQALFIDVKTVEHHLNSMYGKLRTNMDFDNKHPRVSAARLYLESTGELLPLDGQWATSTPWHNPKSAGIWSDPGSPLRLNSWNAKQASRQ